MALREGQLWQPLRAGRSLLRTLACGGAQGTAGASVAGMVIRAVRLVLFRLFQLLTVLQVGERL